VIAARVIFLFSASLSSRSIKPTSTLTTSLWVDFPVAFDMVDFVISFSFFYISKTIDIEDNKEIKHIA
jgi:hypothetical protein